MTSFISNKFSDREYGIHWLPHSVGCLISYANTSDLIRQQFNFLSPIYLPDPYITYDDVLSNTDILCMTNYVWNQTYNDGLAQRFKSINPSGIVVYGGASVPENDVQAVRYREPRPYVDLFFVGSGERNFKTFLETFNDKTIDQHDGTFGHGFHNVLVSKALYALEGDDIPNPFLDGIFDDIIAGIDGKKIGITLETTRGCPFKCSFCDWGGLSRNTVYKVNTDSTSHFVDWIYQHGDKIAIVDIIDANLGMKKGDLDMLRYFKQKKEETGHVIRVTTNGFVKNGSPYLKDCILTLNEISGYSKNAMMSFQSHSEQTLATMDRANIKNDRLYPLISELQDEGLFIRSEMILGLPGETPNSWLYTLDKDHSLGIHQMRAYPLIMIPNTPMYEDSFRITHGIATKRVLIPHDLFISKNKYLADPSRETQCDFTDHSVYEDVEVIYSCNSYSNDELVMIMKYWWWYHNLFNTGAIDVEITNKVNNEGISITDQVLSFYDNLCHMPTFKFIVDHYVAAIREIYAPEPVTKLKTAGAINFIMKGMRTYEPNYFCNNKQALREELLTLGYGDRNTDITAHWTANEAIYLDDTICKKRGLRG